MNFLLLEKEQISCGCFQNSQNNVRKIFRSSSDLSQFNDSKSVNLTMVKHISDSVNSKKKSLKKQKSVTLHCSQKNGHSRQLSKDQPILSEVNQRISNQIEPKTSNFCSIVTPQFYNNFGDRHKSFYVIKPKVQQYPYISEHVVPYSKFNSNQFAMDPYTKFTKLGNNEFQKLVDDQFRKDLQEFQISMKRIDQKYFQKAAINCHEKNKESFQIRKQDQNEQIKEVSQINENEIFTEQQIIELEKQIQRLTTTNKKKCQQSIFLQKIESSPEICQQKQVHQFNTAKVLKRPTQCRERKQSFRNSAISYKGRQLQTKRFKDKMYAKQIQSEKDGSSSESDNMSEVVGRGWDGLTQQRIQIQGLDEMIYNDKKNGQTETMITQESHIKNSQVKTFTQYTSSFISPKTHKPTSVPFGSSFPKYGVAGMSYQHIDDFTKLNNSFLLTRKL